MTIDTHIIRNDCTGHRTPNIGNVFWITGLSGAGKSSLCKELVQHLQNLNHSVIMLDGDELREIFGAREAYSRDERLQLAMRYARLCLMLASQGFNVAIATISMFREVYKWNRDNLPGYVEIFLDVPLSELQRRNSKNIYSNVTNYQTQNIAGFGVPVDAPDKPDVHIIWNDQLKIEDELSFVIKKLNLGK